MSKMGNNLFVLCARNVRADWSEARAQSQKPRDKLHNYSGTMEMVSREKIYVVEMRVVILFIQAGKPFRRRIRKSVLKSK